MLPIEVRRTGLEPAKRFYSLVASKATAFANFATAALS
jgi:hypothetical protein